MKIVRSLAIAGLFASAAFRCGAETITENFSTDPLQSGWQIFGNTNLFQWDSTNQTLAVTWDSTQPNSYFFHPLGMTLTRNDDFSIAFDLRLSDIATGVEPDKTGSLQLGFGFLNFTNATGPDFMRGAYGSAPDVAEFAYYAQGFYDYSGTIYDSPATTTPSFISGVDSFDYCPANLSPYDNELPSNQCVHIVFNYTATNQTAALAITTNGTPILELPPLVLNSANGFADSDNFDVDMFSISSYSSAGDDFDSVLAHGNIANIVVTIPPPAQNVVGAFSNGVWQAQFTDHSGWNYTLERTTNFISWTDVSEPVSGNGTNLFLQDSNPPLDNAFYRVKAERP